MWYLYSHFLIYERVLMESFAFWYKYNDPVNKGDQVIATMNFNLWSECEWKDDPYLDIGFKVKNLENAEELYFFLPFKIKESEKLLHIEDLGCKFNKTELVDAVFNESHATTIAANTKAIMVEETKASGENDNKNKFYIYQLDIQHDIDLELFADGTIITIKTENIINSVEKGSKGNVFYLRFRVKNHKLESLIHKYTSPSFAVQSLFNTTYMIDFRFHNIRSLDKTLIEKFNENGTAIVGVDALHFLLMTKAYVDVDISNKGFKSTRKIEQGVWRDYVNDNNTEDLVAYHFADKAKSKDKGDKADVMTIDSSELFAKFRVEKSVIWIYFLATILIGAIGSVLGSLFMSFFD